MNERMELTLKKSNSATCNFKNNLFSLILSQNCLMFWRMIMFPFGHSLAVPIPCFGPSFAPRSRTIQFFRANTSPSFDTFYWHNMMNIVSISFENQLLVAFNEGINGIFSINSQYSPTFEGGHCPWLGRVISMELVHFIGGENWLNG